MNFYSDESDRGRTCADCGRHLRSSRYGFMAMRCDECEAGPVVEKPEPQAVTVKPPVRMNPETVKWMADCKAFDEALYADMTSRESEMEIDEMNVNDAFPSKYIKASDLAENKVAVTITHVDIEEVGRTKDRKPIVYFAGKAKGLVLNKTNAKKISSIAGSPDTDTWVGVKVGLFATETDFAGETVECVRVAALPKNGASSPAPPPPVSDPDDFQIDDSDVPFVAFLPFLAGLAGLGGLIV